MTSWPEVNERDKTKNKAIHRKLKRCTTRTPSNNGGKPRCCFTA